MTAQAGPSPHTVDVLDAFESQKTELHPAFRICAGHVYFRPIEAGRYERRTSIGRRIVARRIWQIR
jgi:hypothetical protein